MLAEAKKPSLTFGGGKKAAPTSVAFSQAGDRVYIGEYGANSAKVYTYPGARLVDTITKGLPTGNPIDGVICVAVDPKSPQ